MTDAARDFEPHRDFLRGLAYRMLGSVSEAEDVVQDAFLRWADTERARVASPRAFLARVVTRLCLDELKSARARREEYVGPWLPEPVVAASTARDALALADDISVALLLALERLSPLERAAFLLHDVFDLSFDEVAGILERTEPAVRQLSARARDHVRTERPRFPPPDADETARLTAAFLQAAQAGDVAGMAQLLAADVVMHSDGGGKRRAARNLIEGRDRVSRFVIGISRKRDLRRTLVGIEPAAINGLPGFVIHTTEGIETLAFEIAGGEIRRVYAVRNPDKLRHLG